MDSVVSYFGKDIASIIYRCLFQLRMQDINKQYRKFLIPDPDSVAGVCFFAVDLPAFTVTLNRRDPLNFLLNLNNYYSYILHFRFYDNKGWNYAYCGSPLPDNYW